MKRNAHLVLSWIATVPFVAMFALTLFVFEPIQRIALVISRRGHEWSIIGLNGALRSLLFIIGARVRYVNKPAIPADRPLIVLSNHQSLYDIPLLHCLFADRFPRFVAKVELSQWLPSVSYNLKHGENAIIDRGNPRQALRAIADIGKVAKERGFAVVLFPEGTRAKDGRLKGFKAAGVSALLSSCEGALVVPVAIDGSYSLARYKFRPVPFGLDITLTCGPVLDSTTMDARAVNEAAEGFVSGVVPVPEESAGETSAEVRESEA